MSRWLGLFIAFAAALLARASVAAPAIAVNIRDAGIAEVALTGFTAGDFCALKQDEAQACATARQATDANATDSACKESPSHGRLLLTSATRSLAHGTAIVAHAKTTEIDWATALLEGAQLWCTTSVGAPVAVVPLNVTTTWPLTTLAGASRPLNSPMRLDWLGWDRRAFSTVLATAPGQLSCEFLPATNPKVKCQVVRQSGPSGGPRFTFVAESDLPKVTSIKVTTTEAGKTPTEIVTVPVQDCVFGTAGHVKSLYAGAQEQLLQVASSSACLSQLAGTSSLKLAGLLKPTVKFEMHPDGVFLRVSDIPATIALGSQEWDLKEGDVRLGAFKVDVQPAAVSIAKDAKEKPRLAVAYEREELDALQSGGAIDGQAVVTTSKAGDYVAIINRPKLKLEAEELRAAARSVATTLETDGADCQRQWDEGKCDWKQDGIVLNPLKPKEFCTEAELVCQVALPGQETCRAWQLDQKARTCTDELNARVPLLSAADGQLLDTYRDQVRPWRVSALSWPGKVWFFDDWLYVDELTTFDPQNVGFAVYAEQRDALALSLELKDQEGRIVFRTEVVVAEGARRESLPLPISKGLEVECGKRSAREAKKSQPEPAQEDARDRIKNSQVRAVEDTDLDTGQCSLTYLPQRMLGALEHDEPGEAEAVKQERAENLLALAPTLDVKLAAAAKAKKNARTWQMYADAMRAYAESKAKAADAATAPNAAAARVDAQTAETRAFDAAAKSDRAAAWAAALQLEAVKATVAEKLLRQLALYGRQMLEVTAQRGKEPPVTLTWALDPTKAQSLQLPVVKEGSGDYVVTAKLKGAAPADAIYRPGPQRQDAAFQTPSAPAEFQFQATLRPRGFGGWAGSKVRMFVTFPIRFTGVRLPAKASELKSSNDITSAQLTGVRAGTMFVVEPWNYDTRKNLSAIPIRFMTGMNLFDIGSGGFAPAVLTGMSVALPILPLEGASSASTLETTVSLGAFWEVDLETRHPLKDGNHLLISIGLDVLSLFAH